MFIVYTDNQKHSAWNTESEAKNQIRVLKNYGYKNCYFDELNADYENGHYFL